MYTIGGEITCPSELRIKAVDLLLEKLAQDAPEGLLGRVVAISGATQVSPLSTSPLLRHSRSLKPCPGSVPGSAPPHAPPSAQAQR